MLDKLRNSNVSLILIILLGIILRIFDLGSKSIWADEAFAITIAEKNFIPLMKSVIGFDPHPPLFYLLLHFWMYLGKSEFIVRLPSAMFNILAVLLVYKIGKQLFDTKIGLLSALMTAISPLFIAMSQEARNYSMLTFLILLSIYFLLRALSEEKNVYWLGYISIIVISGYTHYYTIFVILATNIFVFSTRKEYFHLLKKWVFSQIIIFILSIPLLFIFLKQYGNQFFPLPPLTTHLMDIPRIISGFNMGYMGGISRHLLTDYLLAGLVVLAGLVFGLLSLKGFTESKQKIFLVSFFIVPLAVIFLLNFFIPVPVVAKRFMFIAPLYYMCIAKGIFSFKKYKVSAFFIVVIVLLSTVSLYGYYQQDYYQHDKPNWRSTAKYIEINSESNDVIGVMVPWISIPFEYYYQGDLEIHGIPLDINLTDRNSRMKWRVNSSNVPIIEKIIDEHDRLWLIQSRSNNSRVDPNDLIKKWLDRNNVLIDKKEYSEGKIKIYLYEILNKDD